MTATATTRDETILLGFDFGLRRIGVAVGNRLLDSARPLTTLQQTGTPDWASIEALIREWRPAALVVGIPVLMDGSEQPITQAARQFASELARRFAALPVHAADERLSSVTATETLKAERQAGRKRRIRKEEKDSMAASIILRDWMQTNP